MGADTLFVSYRDGELPLDAAVMAGSVTYFGGQPAAITTTGTVTLCKTGAASYIGVFKNSSYEDIKNGSANVLGGASKIVLINGSNSIDTVIGGSTVEGAPFDTSQTYNSADLLYISATGFWTNQVGSGINTNSVGSATPKAIVVSPANATNGNMEIYLLTAL